MINEIASRTITSTVSRRTFLKGVGVAGTSLVVVPALMGDADAQPEFKLRAPEPNPKYGGTLRYGVLSAPAHFDLHQSATVSNHGAQSPMYDTLLRRDPRDGQTIIPDLAWKWEIAPDGKKYTFHLRKGVKFHDGADFTAEDVKATYERIVRPPKGVVSPRQSLFTSVTDITVIDPHRIEFRLSESRPSSFMLAAFASGWNVIVRKKTLEENGGDLRRVMNYPGTGPFRHVSRKDKEVWVLEKNPDYWNRGLPYLDRLEIYHMPLFSPELAGALLTGKLDYARLIDPVTSRKLKTTKGMASADFYQSVVHALHVNNKKTPFGDPRVRRAIHLSLDRHVLVDVVKDVSVVLVGGFTYPFSEWASPGEELGKRLGYQKDPKAAIQEARRLMTEAGYPKGLKDVDFLIRDVLNYRLWAVAIQAMLKEAINVETKLKTVQQSQWFDDAAAGKFDIALAGVISSLMDPSDYFTAWYGKGGPLNYSQWVNEPVHELARQIDRELDAAKRKALVRRAEAMMEQDPPLIPLGWEKLSDGWHTYVKGNNPYKVFGLYDVARWDTVWLDR